MPPEIRMGSASRLPANTPDLKWTPEPGTVHTVIVKVACVTACAERGSVTAIADADHTDRLSPSERLHRRLLLRASPSPRRLRETYECASDLMIPGVLGYMLVGLRSGR
jgi:hypothetical protein